MTVIDAYPWMPTLEQVAALIMGRTYDGLGNLLGTFTAETRPTDEQVYVLITMASDNVRLSIGTTIPEDLYEEAAMVVALRTAMLIELTYFGAEVASERSAYPELKALYDEKIIKLAETVVAEESGMSPEDAATGLGFGYPFYGFPPAEPLWTKPM